MGLEAECTVTIGRERFTGRALLESDAIIFRSETLRLKIPLARITSVEASGSELAITHPDGAATFSLGTAAAKTWAAKIRTPKTRAEKLGVKAGQRVAVMNVNDLELVPEMRARGVTVSHDELIKEADVIFLGAERLSDLEMLPEMLTALHRDGCIWTVTPKGKAGIKDTDIMGIAKAAGLVAVKVVSFSATHSANKFVVPKASR